MSLSNPSDHVTFIPPDHVTITPFCPRGRFGCVKTCLSRQEPAQFVAKIVPKSDISFTQFAFELNVGYNLRHPNLVRVKEGIGEKANYIIIMERWALQTW